MTEQTTICTRCGDPILATPYPTRIVGEPYHAACARAEEAERLGLAACECCLGLAPRAEAVLLHATGLIVCLECWQENCPHEDATLMSVVIAEQNRSGDE